jgi:hypothetical protein
MFADEARFGRMNRPRPCWAPAGIRPKVASQLIREYIYLYGAVAPKDGTWSPSIGMSDRDQSESLVAMSRCAQSATSRRSRGPRTCPS